ncbi:T9SS type A sorting domain-containing protein [Aureispira anguillae]|nr:T9SS type A sorting domain-containing protein [Aureispira anguillae]
MLLNFNYSTIVILLLCATVTSTTVLAQSPGGVDPSSSLNLWLKGGDLPVSSNTTGNWNDAHSSNNDAIYTPNTPGVWYEVAQDINFNNSVHFNDETFTIAAPSTLNINVSQVNTFVVYRMGANNAPLWGNGLTNTLSPNNLGKQASSSSVSRGANNTSPYTGSNTINTVYINHFSMDAPTTNGSHVYINGNTPALTYTDNTTVSAQTDGVDSTHQGMFIGKSQINGPSASNLRIAEVIVYTGSINAAQRERVNSYLAIKYGITLPHNYTINSGSLEVWNRTTNAGYNTNITGIARDDNSDLEQAQSKSQNSGSILTLSSASAIPNHQALIVGDNGGGTNGSTAYQVSDNFFAKGRFMNKVWKCQKTAGFTPNVAINIDNSISLPSGFTTGNIFLLVSSNPNFNATNANTRAYPLSNSGGTYTATNVALNDGDYFTIARSDGALWVKADGNNTISGSNRVQALEDHVLGINNMTGSIRSGNQPDHTIGTAVTAMNFNPYITFNSGSNQNYVDKSNFVGFDESGVSAFLVLRRDNNNTGTEAMFSYATPADDNEWIMDDPSDIEVYVEVGLLGSGHSNNYDIEDNLPHIVANVRGNGGKDHLRLDGTDDNENYKNTTVINAGGTFIFGQEQDAVGGSFDSSQEYEGDFAEAIIFNKRVSNNERNAIESYLAIKYGVTLNHDYTLSNNNISWDRSANSAYNENIAGIGRDDLFELDQRKSKSQSGSNVDVIIEHSAALTNQSHLIWGCKDCDKYNTVNSNGAPALSQISQKRWKVQNYNNQVGPVTMTLNIPTALASQNAASLKLLVSNGSNFSTSSITNYTGTISGTEVTFTNVTLPDGYYFTLGASENVGYTNNDAGAPGTFEACIGSNVTFQYANLSAHPDRVQLMDTANLPITVLAIPPVPTTGPYNGSITIIIPSNAGTGNVKLLNGSTTLYNFNTNLIIHNPQLDFIPQTSPVCATDTVLLVGFPSGGNFSSPITNVIQANSVIGSEVGWSPNNDTIRNVPVTYTYFPSYLDGTFCLNSVEHTKDIVVRDNRLESLEYNYIIKNPPVNDDTLSLHSGIIGSVTPDLLDSSFPHPVSFSGTYVYYDTSSSLYKFHTDQADANNPVTLSYDNGGCIGEYTANLDVFPPLRIIGLSDTICTEADSSHFTRDTLPDYAHSLDTTSYNYSYVDRTTLTPVSVTVDQYYEYNKIARVRTLNPAYQSSVDTAILPVTHNSERYSFTPNNSMAGSNVIIQMDYESTLRTVVTENFIQISDITRTISTVLAFDTIYMAERPTPQIGNFDSIYCENALLDTLKPSPFFDHAAVTYFELRGDDGLGYNLLDTLLGDTLFNSSYHYNKLVPSKNRHLDVQLIYTVDRYGCLDSDTTYTKIIAPAQPIFYPQPAYCTSDFPTPLTASFTAGSFPPAGGNGVFFSTPGLDTTTNLFSPGIALDGYHMATYQFTDNFGCISTYTDTLYVREPPQIRLNAGGVGVSSFCANETNVPLSTTLLSGGVADTIRYFGAGVSNTTLDPSAIFLNPSGGPSSGGASQIWNLYIDSFGCAGRDTLDITILDVPNLRIDSLFNSSLTYCGNDPSFMIAGFVLDSLGHLVQSNGTITGGAVTTIDTTYYYDPNSLSVDSIYMDTVTYSHTDQFGCSNAVNIIITIDSIPELTFTGIDPSYCINYPIDQFYGTPDTNVLYNRIVFGGPGVNPNTGFFTPLAAGTGQKVVSYTFEDQNSCENTIYDTTIVYALPTPSFGDYENQYCTAAPNDTLISQNIQNAGSSYFFWGSIIADSSGILDPSLDSSGVKTVYYQYTDSLNCSNIDSVNIFIHPTPEIVISGLDSAYCFEAPEDNISVFPSGASSLTQSDPGFSISGNTITFDPDQDTAGVKGFTYIYTDISTGCADTITVRTLVYKPPTPRYIGLDNFYCETRDTLPITGIPAGGTWDGQGIINNNNFGPAKAGGGIHIITYTVNDTLIYNSTQDTLICQADTSTNVRVRPLPIPVIHSPGNNQRFCSTDTAQLLVNGTFSDKTWNLFQDTSGGVVSVITTVHDTVSYTPLTVIHYPDTTYYFDPGLVVEGTHFVTYIATDSATGCQDSVQHTYIVDDYTNPFFALDSVYCESADSVILFGVPGGGTFFRNSSPILGSPPYFHPNPNYGVTYLPSPIVDTVIYVVQDGACYGSDTQLVRVNPVPQLSFVGGVAHNIYCLGTDSIPLTPNITGGTFTGNGVLFGDSTFRPSIAGVGHHPIYYNYTDQGTGCGNQVIDTFSVFGTPQASFQAIGGCQLDSILFWPDNTILGLNNIFNNQIIDSITAITWEFEPSVTLAGSSNSQNRVDSVYHIFSTPGVYETKLYVENRIHCVDTHTVSLVISPKVSTFPYDETFENSDGNWYAESRDSSHPLLWEWGIDSTASGINDVNSKFWSTYTNASYSENEDAWVYSPCFDIDSLDRPMIKLDYWSDSRTSADGTVLEYQKPDGTWEPLGQLGRGINWFNSSIITGQPGDQSLAPIGWSGKTNGWVDSRYKLDEFTDNGILRLRFAFGSPSVNLGSFYDGFAFDNVWIGSRSRNVLLETTANINESNMGIINDHVYQLVFHTSINKDLVLLQYHSKEPSTNDEFHLDNTAVANARTHYYGIFEAGRAYIDGRTNNVPRSRYLSAIDFEQDMLESPKFKIDIDTFHHNNFGNFTIEATVEALVDLNTVQEYQIHTVITEDSLVYASGNNDMVHAVVRKDDRTGANVYNKTWSVGETIQATLSWNHTGTNVSYNPGRFQAVVFIQNTGTKEVYQVNTSRDVSGYWVGVDQIQAEPELNEINSMNLYPNPAQQYFKVSFKEALKKDYNWKLVDLRGVEVKSGTVQAGEQTLEVSDYDFPTGVYVFVVYNDHVFSQRKVIIDQN